MSDIDVTTWGHSAVRFERSGSRLVIDPGGFSNLDVLASASAVLITHEHPDHLAVDPLLEALAADPALEVWGPAGVIATLAESGPPAERLHEAVPRTEFPAGGCV